ncbi:DUF5810 domain-containing protein [Haloplanus halobius]|uniref:DUF5810 domain-containing protein n=1 Tax=Haloplanus halobius TaxID=2934938 RepID=UPI00200DBB72|nr:DUF5810 domain-containing protein [Haloplanus sp. XH21]
MGYACPVCETPQRDAEHLANHLAFTAMLHGDAHEEWLAEHAPGWDEDGADELAPVVAEHATETTYDEVFDDTVPRERESHEQGHGHGHDPAPTRADAPLDTGELDADARRALAEAREMTEAMLSEGDADADGNEKE